MKINLEQLKEKGVTVEMKDGSLIFTTEAPHVPNAICEQVGNLASDIFIDVGVTYEKLECTLVDAIASLYLKAKIFDLIEECSDEK